MNTLRTYCRLPRHNSSEPIFLVARRSILAGVIIFVCAVAAATEENDQPGDLIESFKDSPLAAICRFSLWTSGTIERVSRISGSVAEGVD